MTYNYSSIFYTDGYRDASKGLPFSATGQSLAFQEYQAGWNQAHLDVKERNSMPTTNREYVKLPRTVYESLLQRLAAIEALTSAGDPDNYPQTLGRAQGMALLCRVDLEVYGKVTSLK